MKRVESQYYHFINLTIYGKRKELIILRGCLGTPRFFGGVNVAYILSFMALEMYKIKGMTSVRMQNKFKKT